MDNNSNFVPILNNILDRCYITEQVVSQSSSQNEANMCPLRKVAQSYIYHMY